MNAKIKVIFFAVSIFVVAIFAIYDRENSHQVKFLNGEKVEAKMVGNREYISNGKESGYAVFLVPSLGRVEINYQGKVKKDVGGFVTLIAHIKNTRLRWSGVRETTFSIDESELIHAEKN